MRRDTQEALAQALRDKQVIDGMEMQYRSLLERAREMKNRIDLQKKEFRSKHGNILSRNGVFVRNNTSSINDEVLLGDVWDFSRGAMPTRTYNALTRAVRQMIFGHSWTHYPLDIKLGHLKALQKEHEPRGWGKGTSQEAKRQLGKFGIELPF